MQMKNIFKGVLLINLLLLTWGCADNEKLQETIITNDQITLGKDTTL